MRSEKEIGKKLEQLNHVEKNIKETIFFRFSDEMRGIKKTLEWVLGKC